MAMEGAVAASIVADVVPPDHHPRPVDVVDGTFTVDPLEVETHTTPAAVAAVAAVVAVIDEEAVATPDIAGHEAGLCLSLRHDLDQALDPPARMVVVIDALLVKRAAPEVAPRSREKTTTDPSEDDLLPATGAPVHPRDVATPHLEAVLEAAPDPDLDLDPTHHRGEEGPAHDRHPALYRARAALHPAKDVPGVPVAVAVEAAVAAAAAAGA
ncbi:hypothetical protein BD289DRAFT_143101 [Coniella lustricola]|uniref:Uncharacterized protein n=1 Tax=Coniella lustricola TaxID=2025994 RepID=A0A2T2ZV60_9PEZI|nr:hypothetical protein BD289DRAFT_143101 [Coniella lustricola]